MTLMDDSFDTTIDVTTRPRVNVLVATSDQRTGRDILQTLYRYDSLNPELCSTFAEVAFFVQHFDPQVVLLDMDLVADESMIERLNNDDRARRVIAMIERSQEGLARGRAALSSGAWSTVYKDGWIDRVSASIDGLTVTTGTEQRIGEIVLEAGLTVMFETRARDFDTLVSIANALEWRESGGNGEAVSVADLAGRCLALADERLAANQDVRLGFVLHDIGKIAIPDHVLTKRGPLSSSEWNLVRGHPTFGAEMVKDNRLDPAAVAVIQCHHERWDGTGYPNGLGREDIPLVARIFSVADAYTAMTSERPYRPAMSHGDAAQIVKWHAGTLFDPAAVDVMLDVVGDGKKLQSAV